MFGIVISWKTTLMGLSLLATAIYHFYVSRVINPEDITAILAGFGLIASKDASVTGGMLPKP